MAFWWVSQNKTWDEEHAGGYLWAPKRNRDGQTFFHWTNMATVRRGDIIFAYVEQAIRAVAVAKSDPYDHVRPFKSKIGQAAWQEDGWRIDVAYDFIDPPLAIGPIAEKLKALLPEKYGPLNAKGEGNVGYLFALPEPAGRFLLDQLNRPEQQPELPISENPHPTVASKVEDVWLPRKPLPGKKKRDGAPPAARRSKWAKKIGDSAEQIVFDHLKAELSPAEAATLFWVASTGRQPGWDIEYMSGDRLVAVEVKGTTTEKFVAVEITANELEAAAEKGNDYWLYLVTRCMSARPKFKGIQDPCGSLKGGTMRALPILWRLELIAETDKL